jgi:hypothetical protein
MPIVFIPGCNQDDPDGLHFVPPIGLKYDLYRFESKLEGRPETVVRLFFLPPIQTDSKSIGRPNHRRVILKKEKKAMQTMRSL